MIWQQLTGGWQNGGKSAKLNFSTSNELWCLIEHLYF